VQAEHPDIAFPQRSSKLQFTIPQADAGRGRLVKQRPAIGKWPASAPGGGHRLA
jgi:hypothetical protein